jgi:predicted PurR-regulated permease PerM
MTPETPPNSTIPAPIEVAPQVLRPTYTALQLRNYALWALGVLAFLALIFWLIGPIMTPFILGAVIAYMGHPLVTALEKHGWPRALGAVLVILLGIAAMVGLIFIVFPLVQSEVSQIAARIPQLLQRAQDDWLPALKSRLGVEVNINIEQAKSWLTENLSDIGAIAAKLAKSAQIGGLAVLGFLGTALLTPLVTFYLLQDWPRLTHAIDDLVPRGLVGDVRTFLAEIDTVLAEFMRGQFLVMAALAVYYAAGLSLVGLKHGVAIGIVTGLLVFIPYIGFGVGLLLGTVSALTEFSSWPPILGVLAVYGIGQIIEGFYLTPRLVGERVGLHPLAVLFALMAFGQVFGFVGVLAAVPVSAIALVALRQLRAAYFASALYTQQHHEPTTDA